MDAPRLGASGSAPAPAPAPEPAAAPPAASGGLGNWLPLALIVLVMPLLAYATTSLLIVPKLKAALNASPNASAADPIKAEESGGGEHLKGAKQKVVFSKVLVNVAGTMGTRYLLCSFTLVGTDSAFKGDIESNRDMLLDLANSTLRSKTISDLEKPEALNQIRSELLSVFNNALGAARIKEIYITNFAIQ